MIKVKLSQKILFFCVFNSQIILAQTLEQRNAIIETYDLNLLQQIYDEFNVEFNTDYNTGIDFINANGLPFEGQHSDGSYFSLRGFDNELNNVEYYVTYNNTATRSSIQTARVQNLHNGTAIGKILKGEDIIYGIWDGAQPLANHHNLGVSRIIFKDGQGLEGGVQSSINHATHVSGTIIGNGLSKIYARGVAPLAKLWSNTWENDLAEMTLEASEGLLVSNHSYGINNRAYVNLPGIFGRYSVLSMQIDQLTFNADMYLPVYAAGNDRNGIYVGGALIYLNPSKNGYDLLTHERVGKNPVVVAAVYGITNYVLETNGSNNVEMSNFSQWGPTDDFRIKPDISAKGVSVYSSTGTGVTNYSVLSGTSMAAPAVTGVFGLWQQLHNEFWPTANNHSGFMKAASLKALMAHTASKAGESDGPNPKFGWGLINAEKGALILKEAFDNRAIFKEYNLSNYQQYEFEIYLDGTQPLIATVSWTDPQASTVVSSEDQTPVLINDLDMRVLKVDTNEVFHPWKLNKSWSNIYAFKGDNDVDPLEKIEYFNPVTGTAPAGVYKVFINHKNTLQNENQNFSVIISGGIISSNLTLDNEITEKLDVKIYPNPTVDFLNITEVDFDLIEIFDVFGKRIKVNAINQEEQFTRIDVRNLQSGYYVIFLNKGSLKKSFKFIKK